MEFQLAKDGRRLYPKEFKAQVIRELSEGFSPAELARRYEIPVLGVLKWQHKHRKVDIDLDAAAVSKEKSEPSVPLSEYRKLFDENKNLKRSLVNMTVDRDIFKDAVDIATKKKWI